MIRLLFDRPQNLKHVRLVFEEKETSRTQEFVLRWSPDREGALREIVPQQWNFSPPHTTTEVEEYNVELSDVSVLELTITPDIGGGMAHASLHSLAVSCVRLGEILSQPSRGDRLTDGVADGASHQPGC